jgi:PIN domain nuclease of toxin-antitoxin system
MLAGQGRLDLGTDAGSFLNLMLAARAIRVLPITAEIATLSVSLGLHGDPADRLIAATTVRHGAVLVTSDRRLRDAHRVPTLW